jgi:hypothetical protein
VIPIVATSPFKRTHSCDFAYFKFEGTLELIKLWGRDYAAKKDCPNVFSASPQTGMAGLSFP